MSNSIQDAQIHLRKIAKELWIKRANIKDPMPFLALETFVDGTFRISEHTIDEIKVLISSEDITIFDCEPRINDFCCIGVDAIVYEILNNEIISNIKAEEL